MKIEGQDPKTGGQFSAEADGLSDETLKNFLEFNLSDEEIRKKIDSLDISADLKSFLYSIATTTIRAGRAVVKLGKKVLEVIFGIMKDFPKATGFMVLGAVLGILVGSIPIIGFVLGPLVAPILVGLGLVVGGLEDIKDAALKRQVVKTVHDFEILKTSSV